LIFWKRDSDNVFKPYVKYYLEGRTKQIPSLWNDIQGNKKASLTIKELFKSKVFDYPKPVELINRIIGISNPKKGDILLDFFAGSSTSAQSLVEFNFKSELNLKFIQVQFPEKTDEKSEAFKAGYKTIAEIGKERIRRVVKKIKEEHPIISKELDLGFKVFKLDSSNIKSWGGNPDNVETSLLDTVENIKPDRTEEDVLYEILLKSGLDLTLPIEERNIEEKKVFNIGLGALFICLADNITRKVAEGIGQWKKECKPEICRVVFRDNGFSDVEKTNSVQILNRYDIDEIRTI
ncbi:MAG: DNA methyltransferase, partial [Flavobacteriaceae bacterium]|nr:DNA methyltransferase [Flavobacteriaceae bacterium]